MKIVALLSLLSATYALANTALPFAAERHQIDQIYEAASRPMLHAEAVGLLTAIAVGSDVSASPTQALKRAGVSLEYIGSKFLSEPSVRAFAVQRLSESGFVEVLPTLERLATAPDAADTSLEVQRAAAIGRWTLKLRGVDSATKVNLLNAALSDRSAGSSVPAWAVDELCETGDPRVLETETVLDSVDRLWGQQAEPKKRLCEAKVELLSTHPNRVQAYHQALSDSRFDEYEVRLWAIQRLAGLHTAESKLELGNYAKSLDAVADTDATARSLRASVNDAIGASPK